ncbi:hypothetical protein BDV06DRAFT_83698 [Aspergillus oleicola]
MADSRIEAAASRTTVSASVNIFSLPTEIRGCIYRLLLAVPHPLYLFQDTGSRLEVFTPGKPCQWLALLYTNRQISAEASAVLYGVNKFTLEEVGSAQYQGRLLKSFLDCIGSVNAGFLSHLCITFPAIQRIEERPDEISLAEAGLQSLERLRKKCSSLRTLEILVYGMNSSDLFRNDLEYSPSFREVLKEVNTQLRGIDGLNKIIVKISSGSPSLSVREFLLGLGWAVISGKS